MGLLSDIFKNHEDHQKNEKFMDFDQSFNGDQRIISFSKATWLTSRGNHRGEKGDLKGAITDFKEAIRICSEHSP